MLEEQWLGWVLILLFWWCPNFWAVYSQKVHKQLLLPCPPSPNPAVKTSKDVITLEGSLKILWNNFEGTIRNLRKNFERTLKELWKNVKRTLKELWKLWKNFRRTLREVWKLWYNIEKTLKSFEIKFEKTLTKLWALKKLWRNFEGT